MEAAWFTAAYQGMKRLPSLADEVRKVMDPDREQRAQEQRERDQAAARAWNRTFAALGIAQERAGEAKAG